VGISKQHSGEQAYPNLNSYQYVLVYCGGMLERGHPERHLVTTSKFCRVLQFSMGRVSSLSNKTDSYLHVHTMPCDQTVYMWEISEKESPMTPYTSVYWSKNNATYTLHINLKNDKAVNEKTTSSPSVSLDNFKHDCQNSVCTSASFILEEVLFGMA